MIYRFVTANTIDQKIVERAAAKRKLEKMIIHKGRVSFDFIIWPKGYKKISCSTHLSFISMLGKSSTKSDVLAPVVQLIVSQLAVCRF